MVLQTGFISRKRRALCWALVGAMFLGFTGLPSVAQQSTSSTNNQGRTISLSDQLRTGLKAFTKSDFDFINKVTDQVNQGKLPRRLVDGTFLWARDRAARRSRLRELRPMVYFRPALVQRAKRIGVKL